jgi:hypothetical protein
LEASAAAPPAAADFFPSWAWNALATTLCGLFAREVATGLWDAANCRTQEVCSFFGLAATRAAATMLFVEFMVRVVRAVKSTLFLFPTKASKRVGMDSQKISDSQGLKDGQRNKIIALKNVTYLRGGHITLPSLPSAFRPRREANLAPGILGRSFLLTLSFVITYIHTPLYYISSLF